MNTRAIILAAVVFTLPALAGCRGSSPTEPPPTDDPEQGLVLTSQKQRNLTPDASQGEMQALAAGNRTFAFELYHQLAKDDGNFFFSPESISEALAMVWAGARTGNESQMAEVLSFQLGQDRLHPAFNALDLALRSRGQNAQGADGEPFRLHIANAIWGQTGYGFLEPFLDVLAENYGAGLRLLDFLTDPEAARVTINDWVAGETEQKIKDLIPPGAIVAATRLVLTNAIYFNAAWKDVFPAESTHDGSFQPLSGGPVTVPMMTRNGTYGYLAGEGFTAVDLPYEGDELSMTVIVPDAGRFAEIETGLDGDTAGTIVAGLQPTGLTLTLPQWKTESKFSLKEQLAALGMTDAFEPTRADFTGINGGIEPLFISDVIHQSYVKVNEKGTEAAAATAVLVVGGSMPPELHVDVDRPFIYVIRDLPTGTILFVGRVVSPAA